jgi:hypothetical protein
MTEGHGGTGVPDPNERAGYRIVTDAIGRTPPERQEVLAALAFVPQLRSDLDGLERAAIDAARRAGASWSDVASALGLASRQAAEQRRLRLDAAAAVYTNRPRPAALAPGEPTLFGAQASQESGVRDVARARRQRSGQRSVDKQAGTGVAEVRRAVADLAVALDAAGGWTAGRPAALLARRTLNIALSADPGPLFDLARLAVLDLSAAAGTATDRANDSSAIDTSTGMPAHVRGALSRLRGLAYP